MIFIPTENIRIVDKDEGGQWIFWNYIEKYDYLAIIGFNWEKSPIERSKDSDSNEYDWIFNKDSFYLTVESILNEPVLPCSLNACGCQPQLRFNKIINKWYCNCQSSAICTKNNDESEIDTLIKFSVNNNMINKKNGFCDNPIEAVLMWNILMAKSYNNIAKDHLKKFKNNI